MAYKYLNRPMTDAEIKKCYQYLDAKRFKDIEKLLLPLNLFALTAGEDFFTNAEQGRGIYLFTDTERAYDFMKKEPHSTFKMEVNPVAFKDVFLGRSLDLYINPTQEGDRTLFAVVQTKGEIKHWWRVCKGPAQQYTLPYGLTPQRGEPAKKKHWWE